MPKQIRTTFPLEESNCVACDRPDDADNFVQCDACDSWWHFSCVKVTDSISDRSWTCIKCASDGSMSFKSGVSGRSGSQLAESMARLKDRQELEKRQLELDLQKRFLDEQQKLLDATVEQTESLKSRVSRQNSLKRVDEWVRCNLEQEEGAVGGMKPLAASQIQQLQPVLEISRDENEGLKRQRQQSQREHCQQKQKQAEKLLQELHSQLVECKQQLAGLQLQTRSECAVAENGQPLRSLGAFPKTQPIYTEQDWRIVSEPKVHPTGNEAGKQKREEGVNFDLVFDTNEQQRYERTRFDSCASKQQRDDRTHPSFSFSPANQQQRRDRARFDFGANGQQRQPHVVQDELNPHGPFVQSNTQHYRTPLIQGPTHQQLAARQSLARDLPTFSGDPSEWPIFISNYTYTTAACGYTDGENMVRLQRCLKGQALEMVRNRLVLPAAVPNVIETLRMRYGRPEVLINALLQKVRSIPIPKSDKLEGLIEYGMAVQALCEHIEAANEHAHLSNPTLLQELVNKLPADQKLMWARYKRDIPAVSVNLRTFGNYMAGIVRDASSVVLFEPESAKTPSREKAKPKGFVNSHTPETSEETPVPKQFKCLCCSEMDHYLHECETFKNFDVDERWRKIRELRLCQNCLFGHGRRSCRSSSRCNIDGCQFRHHPLLHSAKKSDTPSPIIAENHAHRFLESNLLFRVIPVTLYGKSGSVDVFAFIDEGSSITLVENELISQLGLNGNPQPLCLHWTGNTSRNEKNSQKVSLEISGVGKNKRFTLLDARTVDRLNLPSQNFNFEEAVKRYEYLKQVPVQGYQDVSPKLLIGIDNLRLTLPLKVKEGDGSGPVAVNTRLGWCVYGQQRASSNDAYNFHVCECTTNCDIHEALKQYFSVEEVSVAQSKAALSKEELRAWNLLESTTKRVGDRFETGLLWKQDDIEFPDSFPLALCRLKCLERRMERNSTLKENLHRQIQEYLDKGYAHKASAEELLNANPRKVWYVPLGAIMNPKKPGKVRIICDARAKVEGVSLNSFLLKGPDLLTSLIAVLFGFRLYQIAVTADVQEMFHQLLMLEADKHSQRFLFRRTPTSQPEIYVMDVAMFGSTCSPASAQFVKNLNAKEHSEQYPEASNSIINCHYVDDYLESFESEEEAENIAAQVRLVHRNGGFNLRGWVSNSERVLQSLGATGVTAVKSLIDGERPERILGMLWTPISDELSFSTQMSDEVRALIDSDRRPTKRQVLRCVMTLYDPLGLLAPFLIHGKILIQNLWRSGADWDEAVGDAAYQFWREWVKMIECISAIRIPRCYFNQATRKTYANTQLHVFVDASENAYSCAAYFRTIDDEGYAQCSLVAGKAKVAPLKPLSVPRLELQGCVLGTRLMKFVQDNHSVQISKKFLWTDSSTALSWILADPHNYRPYVQHRVGEILESTNADEWRWVPTKLNPADEATKWGSGPYFSAESKWFHGPNFLLLSEEEWPRSVKQTVSTTEEMRPSIMHHEEYKPVVNYERFSRWEKLLRMMVYVKRFVNNTRSNHQKYSGNPQQDELQAATVTILKMVQHEAYTDELLTLTKNVTLPTGEQKMIEKSSVLYQYCPVIDDQGVIRQNSRIRTAGHIPYDTRYPILLPKDHPVTLLLIDWYHRTYRHGNMETVVNEIRQSYDIPKLRSVVKKVSRNCQYCKIRKSLPQIPPMAPIPAVRLTDHVRPFSYVGVDYFGPLLVKIGRSSCKRWVALFTCLTVRAVHLEIAHSLSTASFISCVRRFVSRRGAPAEFFSDNGTNFQGAERILRDQINQGLSATFTNASTKWNFIPPAAPHMGGAWERLVQSVKVAMGVAYSDGKLDEEGLQTLVVEAEGIVNSRPLTYLPLDAEDSEALTPNHFLLGNSTGVKQPAVTIKDHAGFQRETWRQIQRQIDVFWQRWLKEYLPVIRRQTKWFSEVRAMREGDLVMIAEDGVRNGWVRGRVDRVIQDKEGRVRQAFVRTSSGMLRRPASKLAVLDVGNDSSTVLGDAKMHPGEDVSAAAESATLPSVEALRE